MKNPPQNIVDEICKFPDKSLVEQKAMLLTVAAFFPYTYPCVKVPTEEEAAIRIKWLPRDYEADQTSCAKALYVAARDLFPSECIEAISLIPERLRSNDAIVWMLTGLVVVYNR